MSDEKKRPVDVITVGPKLPNGDHVFVRQRVSETSATIEAGTLHTLAENEEPPPEVGEVVTMEHLDGNHYEVVKSEGRGPAKVNSAAYRNGWETIFGNKQTVGQA